MRDLGEADRERQVAVPAAPGQAGVGLLDDVAGPQRVVGVLEQVVVVALVARARARERRAGDERATRSGWSCESSAWPRVQPTSSVPSL